MIGKIDRTNTGFIGRWWWTVDRYTVITIAIIMSIGAILVMASSPAVAERIGLESFYFINRQMIFIVMATAIMFFISFLSPTSIRRIAIMGFLVCLVLMVLVLFLGVEVKGARRWISVFGFSLQPSEFMKTFFAVLTAWVLSKRYNEKNIIDRYKVAFFLYLSVVSLLVLQPDFGMTVAVSLVWGAQLFLAGLPIILLIVIITFGVAGVISAYFFLPHVTQRINNFIDPSAGDNYQVSKSLQAFGNGGIYGRGPGQGL